MKKQTMALLTLLILAFTVVKAQTTLEEYNYLSKGYANMIESGLDMKKGYYIKDIGTWGTKYSSYEREISYKGFYRAGEETPCGILAIFYKTNSTTKDYFCIPHMDSDPEIWSQAFEDWSIITKDWKSGTGYSWAMVKLISFMMSQ